MAGQFRYQDFDLLIEPGVSQGSYRARVLRSPAGESAPMQFTLPFSDLELENFVLKIGQGRRRTRGVGRPESVLLKEFGGKLYSAVFQEELRDVLQRSLSQTRAQGVGLRLRLRLADAPGLADVPWEFLYDPRHNRFLTQSRHTPLVRYLDLPDPPHPLSVEGPLRLLVMVSSPSGYPALDVEREWHALTTALAQQQAEGRVIVERLPATMSELRTRLRREQFHVFHFVGHGFWHRDWRDGVLVMEDRHGQPHNVTGEDLGGLLGEYDQTRLAVLNACEGARSDNASDPFAGTAQSLIQQGLPAVIAMQFEITDDAAIIFARELYAAIADGYPVEAALAEARRAILHEGNPTEWGTPVLYSRAPDGHLFNLTGQAWISEAAREEAERRIQEEADSRAREEAERRIQEEADSRAREEAERRDTELAAQYALASSAADDQDWDQALAGFTMIADVHPGYRDVQERAENARKQQQIARWQAEARRLHQAGQWANVIKAGQRLHALDAADADPDGLVTSARAELAAAERAERLATDYETALRQLDSGNWRQAIETLERVAQINPSYRATPALLDRARRNLTDPAPHATASTPPPRSTPVPVPPSRLARTITGHTSQVLGVAFSPDGRLLATAGGDNPAVGPDGRLLATPGGGDKTARLWDPATSDCLRILTGHTGNYGVWGVAFSPDGRLLATAGGGDKTARLWDPATGTCLRTLTGHTGNYGVAGVAFSPDGRLLATAGGDETARLWDPATGDCLRTLTGHAGQVMGVAFSPDRRLLATAGGGDKTARLWDPATGTCLRTPPGHTGNYGVAGVAFSPGGRLLATAGGSDKTARLWDPATGTCLRILTGHVGEVMGVAFSPDGRLLATAGGSDKTARLWDPATGTCLRILTGHSRAVMGVAFSRDGRLLATAGLDKTARLWD
jgi:DNA-binding beta-propeller fold protein YncE